MRAEVVATQAAAQVRRYLAAGVPVGEQLADQLLLPLALASGSYVTLRPSRHTTTNIAVLRMFMALQVDCEELGPDRWRIALRDRHGFHRLRFMDDYERTRTVEGVRLRLNAMVPRFPRGCVFETNICSEPTKRGLEALARRTRLKVHARGRQA